MKFDIGFGICLFFIFTYCAFFLVRKYNSKINMETSDYNVIEKLFFEKIKEGNISYKLLSIYTPFDLMMIKSLFISENIPYYVEFEHLMGLRPFVQSLNYNDVKFYILEEDYNDAIIVINSYIENKNLNEYKIKSVLRNVFEYLIIAWIVPSPQNYLGIDVSYKNEK